MMKKLCKVLTTALLISANYGFTQDTLSLKQAIETALLNNFDIRLAQKELIIAQKLNNPAEAGFMPVVSANMNRQNNVNSSKQEFFNGDIRQGTNVKSNSLNAGILLNWTIFDGMNMFVSKERLSELETIGEINARMKIENVVYQVIALYHTIVLEQKKLDVLKQSVEISAARKEVAEQGLKIGAASGLDVLQASVDLNTDSSALILQEYKVLEAVITLNDLMARDAEEKFEVSDDLQIKELMNYEHLKQKLREQNPEIALANSLMAIDRLYIKQNRSGMMPNISINTGYNFQKSESEIGIIRYGQNEGFNYGITAGWILFDGLSRHRHHQIAKISASQSELLLEQTKQRLNNELYKVFSAYTTKISLLEKEKHNLEVAKENYFVSTEKHKLGSISYLELRQAQRNMTDAELRFIFARYEAQMTETLLKLLSGTILE